MTLKSRVFRLAVILGTATFCTFFPPISLASSEIFFDNFDDNDISNWVVTKNNCKYNGNPALWQASNGELSMLINGGGCSTYIIPPSIIGENTNYVVSIDIRLSSIDQDRNVIVKYANIDNWYGLHIVGTDVYFEKVVNGVEYVLPSRQFTYSFSNNSIYNISVEVKGSLFDIYINDVLVKTIQDQSPMFPVSSVGLAASAGGIPYSEVWFDNFSVTEINSKQLAVPDLKQYDQLWKDEIYDHAPVWAGNQKTTMERWGCLLTSLTMIGQYYGYSFSPQDLNAWLSSQPHAFTPRGALVTDMFGKYLAHFNLELPKLEYKREAYETGLLTTEIEATRPAILKWKGSMNTNHFVVARGISGDDFLVHDPATNKTLLSELGPSIVSLDTFTPSHTDLSSVVLVVDENYHIGVTNSEGNPVVVEESIEYPLHDTAGTLPQNIGERFVRIPKPQEGTYHVAVTGPAGIYTLHSYVFNDEGQETYADFTGILAGESEHFTITIGQESEVKKDITIESMSADLDGAYHEGFIKSKAIYQLLKRELTVAENFLKRNKTKQYRLTLEVIKKQLIAFTPRHITSDVSALLQAEIQSLLD